MNQRLLATAVLFSSATAWALPSFNPSDFSALTSDAVNSVIQLSAIGGAHHAMMPASDLGMLLGFDAGIVVEGVGLPASVTNAYSLITQQSTDSIPTLIPIPMLMLHKGLPFGIDVGFSYFTYGSGEVTEIGGDLQWTFLRSALLPAVAVRESVDYNHLYFVDTHCYTTDVLVSKNLIVIDPYIGVGMQNWSGSLVGNVNTGALPVSISGSASGTDFHAFAGVPIKLLFLRITAEVERSFAGFTDYGAKISIGF